MLFTDTDLMYFLTTDHYSDYVSSNGHGPYMSYGRVTSYAPPSNFEGDGGTLPWKPGGRVVSIEKGKPPTTWIEAMDGIDSSSLIVLDGSHHQRVLDSKSKKNMWHWVVLLGLLCLVAGRLVL